MEKSQWDLKHLRFHARQFSRLDDFVVQYQSMHSAQLREFADSAKKKLKKVCQYFINMLTDCKIEGLHKIHTDSK